MNTELSVTQIRHQTWALQVQQQIKSGLTIPEWCAQNGIGLKAYQYRKRVVRREMLSAVQPAFSEIPLGDASSPQVPSSGSSAGPAITVTISGVTIGINTGAAKQLISNVIEVIRWKRELFSSSAEEGAIVSKAFSMKGTDSFFSINAWSRASGSNGPGHRSKRSRSPTNSIRN